jgi:hypothetical protein
MSRALAGRKTARRALAEAAFCLVASTSGCAPREGVGAREAKDARPEVSADASPTCSGPVDELVVAFPPDVCRALGEPDLCPLRSARPPPRDDVSDRIKTAAIFTKEVAQELRRCGVRVVGNGRTIVVPVYQSPAVRTRGEEGSVEWTVHMDVFEDGEPRGRCEASRMTRMSKEEHTSPKGGSRLSSARDGLAADLVRALHEPCFWTPP